MLLSTINSPGRQNRNGRSNQARPGSASAHDIIVAAVRDGEVLRLQYQGHPRRIVPLVFGILKNGKKAVLCYKIKNTSSEGPELALRLYHLEKISHLQSSGSSMEVNRKIDYYLTKHFGSVFQKC